jgi:beta-glucanase (GH16 family)
MLTFSCKQKPGAKDFIWPSQIPIFANALATAIDFDIFSSVKMPALFMFSAAVAVLTFVAHAAPPPGFKLSWSDEFNGTALDTSVWKIQTGHRNDAINTAAAVCVTNGCLVITTYSQDGTNYTGFINSRDKVLRKYGYYEASIQFSNAPGCWSAFWLQSPFINHVESLNNPTNGVETDIFEHRCCEKTNTDWSDGGDFALHWNGYDKKLHQHSSYDNRHFGIRDGFHTYGLLWTATNYTFCVDNKPRWSDHTMVSSIPEFFLFTSEVRDKSWAGTIPAGGYLPLNESQIKMCVDYVRYYEPVK